MWPVNAIHLHFGTWQFGFQLLTTTYILTLKELFICLFGVSYCGLIRLIFKLI